MNEPLGRDDMMCMQIEEDDKTIAALLLDNAMMRNSLKTIKLSGRPCENSNSCRCNWHLAKRCLERTPNQALEYLDTVIAVMGHAQTLLGCHCPARVSQGLHEPECYRIQFDTVLSYLKSIRNGTPPSKTIESEVHALEDLLKDKARLDFLFSINPESDTADFMLDRVAVDNAMAVKGNVK